MATKSSNPFQSKGWNYLDKLGESSYIPDFYENDLLNNEPTTPSFRSLSPKIYNQDKIDYFTEMNEEIEDDGDGLYEAMLLNSNFLSSLERPKTNSTPVNRLRQLLSHMNPNVSPLSEALSSTIRSQFSQQPPMVAISMPDPRDTKGKGKFKPNI